MSEKPTCHVCGKHTFLAKTSIVVDDIIEDALICGRCLFPSSAEAPRRSAREAFVDLRMTLFGECGIGERYW